MKQNYVNKGLMILTAIAILGFGGYVFAGMGMDGSGMGMHGSGMGGYGMSDYLRRFLDYGNKYKQERAYGRENHQTREKGYDQRKTFDRGSGYMEKDNLADLSEDDIKKLDQERTAFFNATEELRGEIYKREIKLRNELEKERPDAQKAAYLQKEISELKSDFDQKRINHLVRIKQINPGISKEF